MEAKFLERLERMEAVEEIRRLKALYAKYADNGWPGGSKDGMALARLFTEDGVWDGGHVCQGHAAIAQWFREVGWRAPNWDTGPVRKKMGIHMAINPHITVNGRHASGVWHGFITRVHPDRQQSIILAGKYFDDFEKTDVGWRIKKLSFVPAFNADRENSWTNSQRITI